VAITVWHRANLVCPTAAFLSIPISLTIRGVVSKKPLHDMGRVSAMSTGLTKHYRLSDTVFSRKLVSPERTHAKTPVPLGPVWRRYASRAGSEAMFRVIRHIEHLGRAFPQFGHTLLCKGSAIIQSDRGYPARSRTPFALLLPTSTVLLQKLHLIIICLGCHSFLWPSPPPSTSRMIFPRSISN